MKNLICFVVALVSYASVAQNGISYKAVIKDDSGNVITNDLIVVEFTIREGTENGPTAYQESHTPITDDNGLITLSIGEGTPISGVFETINWSDSAHFLNVAINTGNGLVDLGTTEFKLVPYAVVADSAKDAVIETELIGTSAPEKGRVYNNALPLAYGYVSSTGSVLQGYGITSITRPATGEFEITLSASVEGYPVVIATSFGTTADNEIVTASSSLNSSIIKINIEESGSGSNSFFYFVVYGTIQE